MKNRFYAHNGMAFCALTHQYITNTRGILVLFNPFILQVKIRDLFQSIPNVIVICYSLLRLVHFISIY